MWGYAGTGTSSCPRRTARRFPSSLWIGSRRTCPEFRIRDHGIANRKSFPNNWRFAVPKLRWLLFAILIASCPNLSAQTYDVIIRGGHVIDGAGNPWIKADVGIRAGHIARIGRLDNAQAARVIDATGQVVTPGFIDMHTHSEYVLLYDGNAQSKIRQGVTTEVFGEATSPGPIEGPGVEPNQELLKPLHIDLTWNDLDGYFQRLMKTRSSVNLASYVSSCQVRYDVVGFENRPPTADEMEKMRRLVASSMEQGAVGLANARRRRYRAGLDPRSHRNWRKSECPRGNFPYQSGGIQQLGTHAGTRHAH